jgi:hypothetical protein
MNARRINRDARAARLSIRLAHGKGETRAGRRPRASRWDVNAEGRRLGTAIRALRVHAYLPACAVRTAACAGPPTSARAAGPSAAGGASRAPTDHSPTAALTCGSSGGVSLSAIVSTVPTACRRTITSSRAARRRGLAASDRRRRDRANEHQHQHHHWYAARHRRHLATLPDRAFCSYRPARSTLISQPSPNNVAASLAHRCGLGASRMSLVLDCQDDRCCDPRADTGPPSVESPGAG